METLTQIVFNRILSLFNLKIDKGFLFFEYKLKFGSIDFFVTELNEEGIRKVTEFLELPYTPWGDDAEELFYSLTNSPYFNKKAFTNFISYRKDYQEFVKLIKEYKPLIEYKPTSIVGFRATMVDKFFNTKIVPKLEKYDEEGYSLKEFRNKYNGHLVQKWIPELHEGKMLKETMDEFKIHIEERFDINFLEYLKNRPNKIVRLDFMFFYYDDFEFLVEGFDTDLPF